MRESISLVGGVDYPHSNVQNKLDLDETIYTDSENAPDVRTYLAFRGDNVISQTVQNTAPILHENYRMRQYDDELWRASETFKPYARIPQVVWNHWESLGITEDPTALKAAIELMKEVKVTNRRI